MGQRIYKTPELLKAKKELYYFLKDRDLDPAKDYSKHPKYGEEFRRLLYKLNKERDKVAIQYPQSDIKNLKKYIKMKKDKSEKKKAKKAAEAAVAEEAAKVTKKAKKAGKEEKNEKKAKAEPRTSKYDYPLVDGREMTSEEKKKYRAEQRKAAKGGEAPKKEKKSKKAEAPAEAPASKKEKKDKKKPKVDKDAKKKKKSKKDED